MEREGESEGFGNMERLAGWEDGEDEGAIGEYGVYIRMEKEELKKDTKRCLKPGRAGFVIQLVAFPGLPYSIPCKQLSNVSSSFCCRIRSIDNITPCWRGLRTCPCITSHTFQNLDLMLSSS